MQGCTLYTQGVEQDQGHGGPFHMQGCTRRGLNRTKGSEALFTCRGVHAGG